MALEPRHRGAGAVVTFGLVAALSVIAASCSSGTSPLAASAPSTSPATSAPASTTTVPAPTTTSPPTTSTPSTTTPSIGSSARLTSRSAPIKRAMQDGIKQKWVRVTGVYRDKDATTHVVTLSGPDGGYQTVSEGRASCQLIVIGPKLYVSCNPLGGEVLAGWAEAGAQQVGTQWIAYSPSSPDYQQLSTAITTRSDLSALIENGSIESSVTTFGALTTRRAGSTTTVTAPLVVRMDGESVPGTESITITGASDPLVSSVKATVGTIVGTATLSGWGDGASWKKAVQTPADSAPFSRYARLLTPSTAT